ncbi:MAG: tRNA threonylcarbamoyladenosine dehydratase [Rhodocyclaceae bacterium]|nr:tRNA threonylcarbamoyladenosine dehydratase [Rhodocyclaceae bacterium]MBX3670712.1 tRNA threonylcarbamoyladenosine dehydratase [Rhodocyclaceae bacterium]
MSDRIDGARAFGGLDRLYGAGALARASGAHVAVVGIGGVGSWAAEALARSGVGRIALVDFDHIAESNLNRQVHALDVTLGQAKVVAMAQRIAAINPDCRVQQIEQFATPDNLDAVFASAPHIVIDACDGVQAKTAIVQWCRTHGVAVICCGAAGGKTDATKIRCEDLAHTQYDPLLAKVRARLRKFHAYPRDPRKRFGVEAVFSCEAIQKPAHGLVCDAEPGSALNCHGYGSIVTVTATFGLIAAGRALHIALARAQPA